MQEEGRRRSSLSVMKPVGVQTHFLYFSSAHTPVVTIDSDDVCKLCTNAFWVLFCLCSTNRITHWRAGYLHSYMWTKTGVQLPCFLPFLDLSSVVKPIKVLNYVCEHACCLTRTGHHMAGSHKWWRGQP